jgi:universal stress protein E
MSDQSTILALADANPDITRTITQAMHIARDYGSKLLVAGFYDESEDQTAFEASLKAATLRAIEGFEDVEICTHPNSELVPWTINQCKTARIDFIVKTGHRSETLFYSPTDWHLIRDTKTPLLLLNNTRGLSKFETVLAAVDVETQSAEQKALDRKVLDFAADAAKHFDSTLHAAVCIETSQALSDLDLVDLHKRERAQAPEVMKRIAENYRSYDIADANWHIHAGVPEKVLSGIARGIKADLVVVGTVGRKSLQGLLLGNTAEKILKHLKTHVLVVKPD